MRFDRRSLTLLCSMWLAWAAILIGFQNLVVTAFSGAPQSLIRYVLMVPSLFIQTGRLGRSVVFDRAWTTASLLPMGLLVTLFTFDMWVA